MHFMRFVRWLERVLLCFLLTTLAACGSTQSAPPAPPTADTSQPTSDVQGLPAETPTSVVALNPASVDVCKLLPGDAVAQILGHPLTGTPKAFHYLSGGTDSGCRYDAGKDAQGGTLFAYAVVLSASDYTVYRQNMGITVVSDVADDAFTQNGPDALQLWALVEGRAGVMVAIGDKEDLDGETQLVKTLIAKISSS